MADDTIEKIQENLESPASASHGQGTVSVSQHNLKDQVEVDRYIKSVKASKSPLAGVRMFKIKPGGVA